MSRGKFRIAGPARADIASILLRSERLWGAAGQKRYAALLAQGIQQIADAPLEPVIRQRNDIGPGLCSLHLKHVRAKDEAARVQRPVHLVVFRLAEPGHVEILRILHERMEPGLHGLADD